MCFYDKVSASVAWIREKTEQIPELGVILGSGLDGRKHRRNLNTLVVGGSGAGRNCMRMSFGNNSPEKIREGVMKLGKLIEKKLAQQSK